MKQSLRESPGTEGNKPNHQTPKQEFPRLSPAIPGESVTEEKKEKRKKSFRAEKRKEKIKKEETKKQGGK